MRPRVEDERPSADEIIERLGEIESTVAKLSRKSPPDSPAPLAVSIASASKLSGLSKWTIRDKLRRGVLQGKKSGARTLVSYESLVAMLHDLPDAEFSPAVEREKTGGKPHRFTAKHAPLRRKKALAAAE